MKRGHERTSSKRRERERGRAKKGKRERFGEKKTEEVGERFSVLRDKEVEI